MTTLSTTVCNLNKNSVASRALREGEEKLDYYTHPDPYIIPYMPGGSSFMRNSPPPLDLVFANREGGVPPEIEAEYAPVHADMVPKHWREEITEPQLVDLYRKEFY